MQKRILVALIAVTMLVSSSTLVFAKPSNNLNDKEMELQNNEKQLQQVKQSGQALEDKIQRLDNQIEITMNSIETTNKKIDSTQESIKVQEKNIKAAKDDIQSENEIYSKRMRAMYVSGGTGYLEVIFKANGVGDFISRVENVKKIVEFDNKIISDLKLKKGKMDEKNKSLSKENSKLVALKLDNKKKLDNLNKDKENQQILISQNNVKEAALGNTVVSNQGEIKVMKKELETLLAENSKVNTTTTVSKPSLNNSKVVEKAVVP